MSDEPTALLERLGRAIVRHPRRFVVGTLVPCVLLCAVTALVPRDLSFRGVLPEDDPRVRDYFELSDKMNLAGRALILLEGEDDARLLEAAQALERELEALDEVADVVVEPPTDWMSDRAPWFVHDAAFDAWIALAAGPAEPAAPERVQELLALPGDEAAALAVPGARLVGVQMADDPFEIKIGIPPFFAAEAKSHEVAEDLGVQLGWAGVVAVSAQDQVATITRVGVLMPLSLIVVLLLLRFVEPRLRHLLAVAVPMVVTVGATFGVVGLILGKVTFIEGFFGVLVFGLGVDYALHLIVRHREERADGASLEEALPRVLGSAGSAVVVGAVTTAGAFAIAALAPDPMARHIATASAVGLALCLVLMLTQLPAIWVLLERRDQRPPAPPLALPWLRPVATHAAAHPVLHVAVGLVVLAVALAGAPRLRWETDLANAFSRDLPALETARRAQELFGANSSPWFVPVDGLDEARRVTEAFEAEPLFDRVEGIGRLFAADLAERERRIAAVVPLLAGRSAAYRALDDGESATAAVAGPALLAALATAHALGRPTPEGLPAALRSQLLWPSGEYLVLAYPAEPHLDGARAALERERAQAIHPDAAGFGLLLEVLMASERPWMVWVLVGILAFVLVLLVADLRDPRWVVVALAPVVVGAGVTFGILCWAGLGFGTVTAVAVPLLLGLGVDDGVHVVHRLRERPHPTVPDGVVRVGRAIVMTTVTTCASVGVLLFTEHTGLQSLALVILIGLPLCLLASITLAPALVVLLGLRRG
jgi:uncharacterized protein